jgi:hypothetical protein
MFVAFVAWGIAIGLALAWGMGVAYIIWNIEDRKSNRRDKTWLD